MNEKELMFRPLKISFIRKNYITNYESNYEEYLTEYINNSKFVYDHGNEKFKLNKAQANKEPDAENKEYKIEYKLLIDNKTMENFTKYSDDITIEKNGERIFSTSKFKGKWRRYLLTNIIKNIPLKRLKELEDKEQIQDEFDSIVSNYLNKIRVNKNALYFLPYMFFYKNIKDCKRISETLSKKFSKDLKSFIEYRKEYTTCDTYLCFFISRKIIFLKYDSKFIFYDAIDINKSDKFMELWDINDIWDQLFWNE